MVAATSAPALSKLLAEEMHPGSEASSDAELEDAVTEAANAFAQIAAGAQEIDAMMGADDDERTVASAAAAAASLPTFVEIHDGADAAAPEVAVDHQGLLAVSNDAIFAAANSAAMEAAPVEQPQSEELNADLEAALEAAAMSGNALLVVDDDATSPEAVPVAGEKGKKEN